MPWWRFARGQRTASGKKQKIRVEVEIEPRADLANDDGNFFDCKVVLNRGSRRQYTSLGETWQSPFGQVGFDRAGEIIFLEESLKQVPG